MLFVSFIVLGLGWVDGALTLGLGLAGLLWIYSLLGFYVTYKFNQFNVQDNNTASWGALLYSQLLILALLFNFIFICLDYFGIEDALLFLMLITSGFSAASVGAYHQLKWAAPLFLAGISLPQVIYYLCQYSFHGLLISILLLNILCFLTYVSLKQHWNWIRLLLVSFELEQAKDQAEKMARLDLLTNLYNRRAFYELAPKFLANAQRHEQHAAMVMMDIDHFKQINDQHGHSTGDAVLKQVAEAINSTIRESDLVARLGGEEFAFLLIDNTTTGAFHLVERLRQKIQSLAFFTKTK